MSKGSSVDVSSSMTMQQIASERSGGSYGKLQATVKMDEKNIRVSGIIINKWHDKVADIMYTLI